jgi:hypothetical protein
MTQTVSGPDGRMYLHISAGLEPVFVAEQPRQSSAADTPHTGFALLSGWLAEPRPGADPRPVFARVRCEDGSLLPVHAGAICPIDGLAAHRILPKRTPRLVAAPAEVWR